MGAWRSNRIVRATAAFFWQRADGQSPAERLTTAAQGVAQRPESFSHDGKYLLFTEQNNQTYALYTLSLEDKKVAPFGHVTSREPTGAVFSPNGQWVAYASTGQSTGLYSPDRGIFIQSFPPTGVPFAIPKKRIDYHPAWTRNGKSLIYIAAAPNPLVVVDVRTEPSVSFGTPRRAASPNFQTTHRGTSPDVH